MICFALYIGYYMNTNYTVFIFLDMVKLLNTILHAKEINTQLEGKLALACLDVDCDQKSPRKEDENNDTTLSNFPLILQSSHLEDSNFKHQFFITRSSFQVSHCLTC